MNSGFTSHRRGSVSAGICIVLLVALCPAVPLAAEVFTIQPAVAGSDCVEEFEQVANALRPGDRLVLRGGRYEQSCRRALSLQGTEDMPIVIEAAPGETPVLTRPDHNQTTENNLELIDARYVVIRGIEFSGGSIGVRLLGETRHLELAHSSIHNTGNNAFAANTGSSTGLFIHHNTVYDTGQSGGQTEGEGFYLGCHDRRCQVTNSRITHNRLYRLNGQGGGGNDGIEVKPGSGGNLIAHNVIEGGGDANDFPCVVAYGGGDINVIENNVLTHCSTGVFAVSDAVVRGNVIRQPRLSGITIGRHQTIGAPANVHLINNSIDARGRGVGLSLWLFAAEQISVINNAVFAGRGVALTGLRMRNADFMANRVEGRLRGVPLRRQGIELVTDARNAQEVFSLQADFVDAGVDSPLANGTRDIEGTERPQGKAVDIGAYEWR